MTLNCQKHDSEIQKAFEKVVNSKTGDEWAIFEYEGTTNILKLGAEGDGGLDEFGTSFNSGRLQYGVISVRLDTNVLPKIVLVHWQGEQVPSSRTAATAVHAQDLRRHFRLIHVLHYARAEMDVEPDVIRKVVQKIVPGAANSQVLIESSYSIPTSVGSVYCPIKPHMDLSLKEREKFWQEMNREEKTRKEEEKQHQAKIIAKGVIRSGNGPKSASAPKNDSPSHTICPALVTSNQGSSLISSPSANLTDTPKVLSPTISSSPQVLQPTPISKGLCAVALWDYEASDISEISFKAESLLTEIQQIDEGWWNGRSPSGKVGLFPANYVRLI